MCQKRFFDLRHWAERTERTSDLTDLFRTNDHMDFLIYAMALKKSERV